MTTARMAAAAALLAAALPSSGPAATRRPFVPLAQSPELWATVDLCNTARHPNEIGIRGSMPTDGHPRDVMYMRFLVQSLDLTTHQWTDLGTSADSGFVQVGSAALTRQDGRNFGFEPSTTNYTVRGFVEFQWRRAGHLVHLATRLTTARHTSLAGAEPKGFSAATCTLT